jgi:hypothetical protein
MQLKSCLMALVLATGAANAAPQPKIIMIELETHELTFSHQLPPTMAEPGGLFVPPDADKEWLELGLLPGDIIRYANGSAVTDHFFVADGVSVLDVIRNGKPIELHILVHGASTESNDLTDVQFKELVAAANNGPISTPLLRDGKPSGVRIVDMMMSIYTRMAPGDIVRTINGVAIHSDAELVAAIQALKVGRTQILVEREGRTVTITLTRATPLDFSQIHALGRDHFELPRVLAHAIGDATELITEKMQSVQVVKDGVVHGWKLFGIENGSLGAALGLENDDVVLDINFKPLDSSSDVYSAVHDLGKERTLTLHLERKGKPHALGYTLTD